MERYAESTHPKGKIPSGQTTLGTGASRNYSFPDDWEECWRRSKGKIPSGQTGGKRLRLGIILFK